MTAPSQTSRPRRKTSTLPPMQVARVTLPDEIYRQLKSMILDGGLIPGELVTIQGLANAFGVSAMPVREALQRLTAERALTVISGRSVGIPEVDSGRLRDLTRVRVEIESLAAQWATPHVTAADLAKLELLVETMARAANDGDTPAYVRGNHEFHFTVYGAAGSETLLSTIEGLWLQVSPYFHLLHGSGNYLAANEEHRLILQAIRGGNADGCAAHVRADILSATDVLLKLLS
ncbi:GntR family transcriptional regulator [Dongia sp.]|uniref:GntR family transcriptional regulator n=1 Tax=Dongia sp. TaxID=1977262 RepID=UPI0035B2B37C